MIRIQDTHVIFNRDTPLETHALRGLALNIKKGEFLTVIGGNGAGKSTLLNALTGTIPLTAGTIKIDGVDVTRWSAERRAGLVARVFQDPMAGTCADLTIEENLALAYRRGQPRRFKWALTPAVREEFRARIAPLGLGLENRLRDPMGMLSGGQRQTLSLIMAVLCPMKILVLDEHTAALDPKTADFVLKLTCEVVKERDLTVLMVTHSMHQALEVGTRTLMLDHGKVAFDIAGKKRENLTVPDLLTLFKQAGGGQIDDDRLLLD